MFDCVIPAAGASSRMGRLKPLLPFAGSTLVETAVQAALGAGCRVLLVVGHRGAEVAAPFGVEAYAPIRDVGRLLVVDNPRWEDGLLSSIQAALTRVEGEAFFVAHADMPFVGSEVYGDLASARAPTSAERPLAAICAACGPAKGHPVLLPSAWIPGILALPPGGRLRDFLEGRPSALVEAGPGALRDIDTPEDYCAAAPGEI